MSRYARYKGQRRRNNNRNNYQVSKNRRDFGYVDMGKKIYNDVQYLKSLINTEFKCNDPLSNNTLTPNTAGSLFLLTGLNTGDQADDRDGRVVRWKSVQLAFTFTVNTAAIATFVRSILFIDKQPNQTLALASELLDIQAITTFRNLDNRKRFVILWDKVIEVHQGHANMYVNYYRTTDMKTIYDDSDGGDISDITTNAMYLLIFSDEAVNTPTVIVSARLRFIDN